MANHLIKRDPTLDHVHNIEAMSFNGVLAALAEADGPVELAKASVAAGDLWDALEALGLVVEPE